MFHNDCIKEKGRAGLNKYKSPFDIYDNSKSFRRLNSMEYLYHYTNLSSLALIFKNKTFRFNSLINMDDAEEVKTKNSPFLGKYCFISSWTDIEAESIPFWGLYTDNMSGIRIERNDKVISFGNEFPNGRLSEEPR